MSGLLINFCKDCKVVTWDDTMCSPCIEKNETLLRNFMNKYSDNVCPCGNPSTCIAKTPNAVWICGKCRYTGTFNISNGEVVLETEPPKEIFYLQ